MKWIYRIFSIAIIGVAIGLPFFIDNKQGQPMLSLPSVDDLKPDFSSGSDGSLTSSERVFYKWQDKNGQWNFGDEPPPDAKNLVPVTVDINANIVQSVKLPPPESVGSGAPQKVYPPADNGYKPPASGDDALTFDRALNIVNDAHAVKDMMESRNRALESYSSDSKSR